MQFEQRLGRSVGCRKGGGGGLEIHSQRSANQQTPQKVHFARASFLKLHVAFSFPFCPCHAANVY